MPVLVKPLLFSARVFGITLSLVGRRLSSPRRAGQKHGDLRRALLQAATELLLEGGEVSLRAVARRAGVAPAAPYHHFPDKEALVFALAEDGFRGLEQAQSEAVEGEADPKARLRAMLETYMRYALAHGDHYRMMFPPQIGDLSSPWNAVATAAFQRLSMSVAAVRISLTPVFVMKLATAVWALCHGVVLLRLDGLLVGAGPFATDAELIMHTTSSAEAIIERTL